MSEALGEAAPKLDPQARAYLDAAARASAPEPSDLAAVRRAYRDSRRALAPATPEVAQTRALEIPGPAGAVPARYYRGYGAEAGAPLPCLVYFHGGGWVCGDLDTHDTVCRGIANHARCAVVSVDYRLAPEHRFPAAVDDAAAALAWVLANAAALDAHPERIVVGGDSAGGNLAAVAALMARDAGGPAPALQVLFYPVTDLGLESASYARLAQGYGLTREDMRWYRGHYLGAEEDAADWRASPLRARDVSGLPPAYVVTAGFDPLHDEGEAYARRLADAGVAVTYECFEGQIHGFLLMGGVMAAARHAVYRIGQAIRSRFFRRTM
ncbi:MAG TPA: alpha/beta hydrolase [Burkholderiales bacterium]|nr:alpha/beta hydrolase [Burkholderiales bacterium]